MGREIEETFRIFTVAQTYTTYHQKRFYSIFENSKKNSVKSKPQYNLNENVCIIKKKMIR